MLRIIKSKLYTVYQKFKILYGFIIGNVREFSIVGLYEYSINHNCIVKMINSTTSRKFLCSVENKNFIRNETEVSRIFFSLLNNVYVLGDTDGFCIDSNFVYDRADWDKKSMFRFKSQPIVKFKNNSAYIHINKKTINTLDNGISLVKMWSSNYFHFTFEVIARLADLDSVPAYKDWPLLVDEVIKNDSRSLDFLITINKNNRKIIFVNYNTPLLVKKLLVPPRYAWASWDQEKWNKGFSWFIENDSISFIKKTILESFQPTKQYRKVFVIRGNNNRLVNESELQDIFTNNGFEIFNPDKYTFIEEVECFATADIIVSCVGAALTNMIYCKSNAKIFIITPKDKNISNIYRDLGMNVDFLEADFEKQGNTLNNSKFRLNPDKLKNLI